MNHVYILRGRGKVYRNKVKNASRVQNTSQIKVYPFKNIHERDIK